MKVFSVLTLFEQLLPLILAVCLPKSVAVYEKITNFQKMETLKTISDLVQNLKFIPKSTWPNIHGSPF